MNWKVLVEQFLEGYHIRSTHKDTFYPIQYDDLNVVEAFGPNTRITFPYQNIERLRDRPESTWNVDHRVTYVYHSVPERHVRDVPQSGAGDNDRPGRHRSHHRHDLRHGHARRRRSTCRPTPTLPRARAACSTTGGVEDNEMSEGVQRGLHAGANAFLEFGTHEARSGASTPPRRAAGVHPMSDYEHLIYAAARAGHDHHDQPARSA